MLSLEYIYKTLDQFILHAMQLTVECDKYLTFFSLIYSTINIHTQVLATQRYRIYLKRMQMNAKEALVLPVWYISNFSSAPRENEINAIKCKLANLVLVIYNLYVNTFFALRKPSLAQFCISLKRIQRKSPKLFK